MLMRWAQDNQSRIDCPAPPIGMEWNGRQRQQPSTGPLLLLLNDGTNNNNSNTADGMVNTRNGVGQEMRNETTDFSEFHSTPTNNKLQDWNFRSGAKYIRSKRSIR